MRASQWDTVRRGELVMKLYSPDYMSAEAEYLAATSSASQSGGPGTRNGAFGILGRLQHGGKPEGSRRAQA